MMSLVVASAVYMAAMQASITAPRSAFAQCLRQAGEKAKSEKIDAEAFMKYATDLCSAEAANFKTAVVSFDVKNGVSRKEAAEGADLQIEDYLVGSADNYRARNKPVQAAAKAE